MKKVKPGTLRLPLSKQCGKQIPGNCSKRSRGPGKGPPLHGGACWHAGAESSSPTNEMRDERAQLREAAWQLLLYAWFTPSKESRRCRTGTKRQNEAHQARAFRAAHRHTETETNYGFPDIHLGLNGVHASSGAGKGRGANTCKLPAATKRLALSVVSTSQNDSTLPTPPPSPSPHLKAAGREKPDELSVRRRRRPTSSHRYGQHVLPRRHHARPAEKASLEAEGGDEGFQRVNLKACVRASCDLMETNFGHSRL